MDLYMSVFGLVAIVLIYLKLTQRALHNFPPGPRGWPVFGNLLGLVCKHPHKKLRMWARRYGSVTGLYFARQPVIILNDWAAVKEALIKQGDNFYDRFNSLVSLDFSSNGMGITYSEDEFWKIQRKFVLGALREMGFGKTSMDEVMQESANQILTSIDQSTLSGSQAISTKFFFDNPTMNVLLKIIAGGKIDDMLSKEDISVITKGVHIIFEEYGKLHITSFVGFVYHSPLMNGPKNRFNKTRLAVKAKLDKFIDSHKATYKSDTMRDFIDLYLKEILKQCAKEKLANPSFSVEQLQQVLLDLVVAGMETSATALRWALAYMCKYKDVQKKIQCEIDEILGKTPMTIDGRAKLVYTEAVLLEVQRFVTMVPLGLPHKTLRPCNLLGYTIPANTLVLANLYAVHFDPEVWNNPESFMPERFIKDGKLTKPECLVQFSCGKRMCPAEQLAKHQLSVFFVTIIQHYWVEFSKTTADPDLCNAKFDFALTPPEHYITFNKRL